MKTDSEIEQRVLRSLKLDPAISSREICVRSHCGIVTLSGTVPSNRECSAINSATRRAPGVSGVVNTIEVTRDRRLIPAQSLSATRSAHSPAAPVLFPPAPDDMRLTRATDGKSKAREARRRASKEAVTG